MATKIPVLPVIFRAEKSGDFKNQVTAVFPTLPGSGSHDFTVYAHVGQHGTGSHGWYARTRAAKPAEYAPLLAELRRIYEGDPREPVKLRVVERFTSAYDAERRKAMTFYRSSAPSAAKHESGGNPRVKKHPLDAAAVRRIERAAARRRVAPSRSTKGSRKRAPFTSAQRKQRGLAPLDAGLKSRIDKVLGKK